MCFKFDKTFLFCIDYHLFVYTLHILFTVRVITLTIRKWVFEKYFGHLKRLLAQLAEIVARRQGGGHNAASDRGN